MAKLTGTNSAHTHNVLTHGMRFFAALAVVAMAVIGAGKGLSIVLAQGAQPGITSPAPGSAINGNVPVFGTAMIEPFQKYELYYKLEPSGDDAYIYFDGSTSPRTDSQLGVWMAEGLPPGTYSLRLRVVKQDGNYAEYFAPNLGVNTGPSPSATPDESGESTPTPIPTATFTPAPQPTPIVGPVEQPDLGIEPTPTEGPPVAAGEQPAGDDPEQAVAIADAGAGPEPAAEEAGASTSVTRELGEALSLNRLRTKFINGVRVSAALMLGFLALYLGKKLFTWVWVQFT